MEQQYRMYRGKTLDTKEWIYGSLILGQNIDGEDTANIGRQARIAIVCTAVDPKTVGQCVGDIEVTNGDELTVTVWEGDKIQMSWQHDGCTNYDYDVEGVVIYDESTGRWIVDGIYKGEEWRWVLYSNEREELCNIIVKGTIHDEK